VGKLHLGSLKKNIFNIPSTKPFMEDFKLPIIGTLFCYAKKWYRIFENPVVKFF